MADNPYSVRVPSVFEGLMAGEQGYASGQKYVNDRETKAGRQEAMQALESGGDLRGPLAKLLGVGDYHGAHVIAEFAKHQAEGNGVFGTPIYGVGPNNENKLSVITKSGQLRELNQEGFTPTPGVQVIDTGTGYVGVNKRSGANVPLGGPSGGPLAAPPAQGQPIQPPPFNDRFSAAGVGSGLPQGAAPPPTAVPSAQPGVIAKDVVGEARLKKQGTEEGENLATYGKARQSFETITSNLDRLANKARSLQSSPGLPGITGLQGVFPNMPGGKAANSQAALASLKAQVGFDTLQAMRDASKTGGALGSVSDAEGVRLENALVALSQSQDLPSFKKALGEIIQYVDGAKTRIHGAFQQDYARLKGGGQAQQPQAGGVVDYSTYFGGGR